MDQHAAPTQYTHVLRIDKFIVPTDARAEFLARVRDTHALLRKLPGFVRDSILEQISGPGRFNLVTTVEWTSEAAIERAKSAVMEMHRQAGFDAAALTARLGVTADIGTYGPVAPVEVTAPRPKYQGRWLRA